MLYRTLSNDESWKRKPSIEPLSPVPPPNFRLISPSNEVDEIYGFPKDQNDEEENSVIIPPPAWINHYPEKCRRHYTKTLPQHHPAARGIHRNLNGSLQSLAPTRAPSPLLDFNSKISTGRLHQSSLLSSDPFQDDEPCLRATAAGLFRLPHSRNTTKDLLQSASVDELVSLRSLSTHESSSQPYLLATHSQKRRQIPIRHKTPSPDQFAPGLPCIDQVSKSQTSFGHQNTTPSKLSKDPDMHSKASAELQNRLQSNSSNLNSRPPSEDRSLSSWNEHQDKTISRPSNSVSSKLHDNEDQPSAADHERQSVNGGVSGLASPVVSMPATPRHSHTKQSFDSSLFTSISSYQLAKTLQAQKVASEVKEKWERQILPDRQAVISVLKVGAVPAQLPSHLHPERQRDMFGNIQQPTKNTCDVGQMLRKQYQDTKFKGEAQNKQRNDIQNRAKAMAQRKGMRPVTMSKACNRIIVVYDDGRTDMILQEEIQKISKRSSTSDHKIVKILPIL